MTKTNHISKIGILKKFELRLELIKLVHSHGLSKEQVMERARDLEDFILEGSSIEESDAGAEAQKGDQNSESKPQADKRSKKKSDNLDSLL